MRTLEGGEICNNILCEMDALINETYFLNPNTTEEDIDALETADYTIGLQTFSGSVTILIHILLQIFSFNKKKLIFFLKGLTWIHGQNVQWKYPHAYPF